jgi:hypothetical protein
LDKNAAILYFRQVVEKKPQSGQGLYRPLGCKKGLRSFTQLEGNALNIFEANTFDGNVLVFVKLQAKPHIVILNDEHCSNRTNFLIVFVFIFNI